MWNSFPKLFSFAYFIFLNSKVISVSSQQTWTWEKNLHYIYFCLFDFCYSCWSTCNWCKSYSVFWWGRCRVLYGLRNPNLYSFEVFIPQIYARWEQEQKKSSFGNKWGITNDIIWYRWGNWTIVIKVQRSYSQKQK